MLCGLSVTPPILIASSFGLLLHCGTETDGKARLPQGRLKGSLCMACTLVGEYLGNLRGEFVQPCQPITQQGGQSSLQAVRQAVLGNAFRVVPFKQALHVGAHFTQQLFQAFAVGGLYA